MKYAIKLLETELKKQRTYRGTFKREIEKEPDKQVIKALQQVEKNIEELGEALAILEAYE